MTQIDKTELVAFKYDAYLCSYNAERNIEQVIYAIEQQTIKPRTINIFDDNSNDNTQMLLMKLQDTFNNIRVIYNKEKHEYDASRIAKNFNEMLNTEDGWILILSDDVIIPQHYIESLVMHVLENKNVAVISGNETLFNANSNSPRGSGRLINTHFFNNSVFKGRFPEDISFESALLFLAQYEGYDTRCIGEIKYQHIRANGELTGFKKYGQSMKNTGYSKLYVLGRVVINMLTGSEFPRTKALSILMDYIKAKDMQLYPQELKHFIKQSQHKRMIQKVKTVLNNRFTIILYVLAILLSLSGVISLK